MPSGLPPGLIAASHHLPRKRQRGRRRTKTHAPSAGLCNKVGCCGLAQAAEGPIECPGTSPHECQKLSQSLEQQEVGYGFAAAWDRLIVEVLDEEEQTVSGIVLPDTAKEKPQRGRVLAVGLGTRDEDGEFVGMEVAEGDEIVFSKYGGTEIKVGSDEYLILRESDVLAKVVGGGKKSAGKKKEMAGASA